MVDITPYRQINAWQSENYVDLESPNEHYSIHSIFFLQARNFGRKFLDLGCYPTAGYKSMMKEAQDHGCTLIAPRYGIPSWPF